jgi:hypothetical protein
MKRLRLKLIGKGSRPRRPFTSILSLAAASLLCFVQPLFSQTNLAVLANDGAWTWFNDPRALFHNGNLYFGFVRSDGSSMLNVLNMQSGTTTNLWSSTWKQFDDHDNCGLLELQDGRLLALYARHGSANTFSYRSSLSTNPVTPADWGAEQTSANTGAGLTYCNPYQLAAEGGKVYDFCRDLNFNPTVLTSSDSGNTWSPPQLFIKTGTGSTRPYVKYCSDFNGRIDVLYTDGHPRDVTNSLYHLFYQGGALYQTDGTFLKSFSSLPLDHDAGERGSVIYQYSDAPTDDPNDHIPTGRAWCWELVPQTNGWPVCVFSVQVDTVAGPNWTDDRIYYYYARWTGTNWQKRFIAQAGRPLYQSENDYAGGIALDPENPSTVYVSTIAANPFDLTTTTNVPLGPHFELYKGVTTNGGLSFAWTPLTTNSTVDNFRPYVPRNRQGVPALLWFRGNYSAYTSFSTSVVGLFTNAFPTNTVVSGSVISHWPLDAASGGATPDVISGNDFKLFGNPTITSGAISNAFSFDGSSQYLSITHGTVNTNGLPVYQPGASCTIAFWVRGAAQTAHYIYTQSATNNNTPLFLLQTGQAAGVNNRLDMLIRTTSNVTLVNHVTSLQPFFDGNWHHAAYVDNAGAVQVYVDGNADTNFTYAPSGSLAVTLTSLGALVRSNAAGFFNGSLDDVAVWSRALTQAEIRSVMTNSIPTAPANGPMLLAQSPAVISNVFVGDTVNLFVQASGSNPLRYQWRKNGSAISAALNSTATNSTLTLSNLQLSDAGAFTVVVTNFAGSVTSSVSQLIVGTYVPVTNGLTLSTDVDLTGTPDTQAGFEMFTLGNNGALFSNAVTMTLAPLGGVTLAERHRGTGLAVTNNPPALTQAQLYNDFVFAAGTFDGAGMSVQISHLAPNTLYGLSLWSYDPQSPGLRMSDWTETASGTPLPVATGYSFDGTALPSTDFDYTFGALLRSSSTGQLRLEGVRHGGTSYGVFLNALQLVANPVVRIVQARRNGNGNLELTVQIQFPGQQIGFQESPALAPAAWQPANGMLSTRTQGSVMTVEFPFGTNANFYRAMSR